FRHQELTDHNEVIPERYKEMEQGMSMESRVTRWDPPHHLAYTWDAGSEVSFDLEPRGNQVLLTLTHRALPSRDEMIDVAGGWHSHLDVLTERLSGKAPAPFWPRVERYNREYPERIK
ncbi:MAG TPA: SRPBCC domain-containing protein, partial [Pseudomonadales bacterium]